jgi:hypothetical protein
MAANYAELAEFDKAILPDIKVQLTRLPMILLKAGFIIMI